MMRLLVVVMAVVVMVRADQVLPPDVAEEGQEYTLSCSGTGPVQYWLLHGEGVGYMPGETYEYESLTVTSEGDLVFKDVSVSHEGTHTCVYTQGQGDIQNKGVVAALVDMRVKALPPANPWKAGYQSQFITGLVAAIVCASIFTLGCLVHRYRYREVSLELLSEEGHVNAAMEAEKLEAEHHDAKYHDAEVHSIKL